MKRDLYSMFYWYYWMKMSIKMSIKKYQTTFIWTNDHFKNNNSSILGKVKRSSIVLIYTYLYLFLNKQRYVYIFLTPCILSLWVPTRMIGGTPSVSPLAYVYIELSQKCTPPSKKRIVSHNINYISLLNSAPCFLHNICEYTCRKISK